jgi:outer membrane lipoprotein-sorting protein
LILIWNLIDDDLYDSILKYLPGGNHYTVIFTTTPTTSIASSHQVITYDPEFQDPFHMDLKRDVWTNKRSNESNSTDFRPLFEKYNYFGPGT